MTVTVPPGGPTYAPSVAQGAYLVYLPWATLPLGTVVRRNSHSWEAFTRLGRSVGTRETREKGAAALAAWTWSRMPATAKRHALREMHRKAGAEA